MEKYLSTVNPEKWAIRFFTVWGGQAFSLIGSALVQFTLVWHLTLTTGSATGLATAAMAAMLPQILLAPFVGAFVDRWNRRRVMIAADAAIALATGFLIYLFASGSVQVWHIYLITAARSLGAAFHQPAMSASTTLMVPDRHLARVAGTNQTLHGVTTIFAPPLGALLINLMPIEKVLAIDIFTASLAILSLIVIPIPQPPRQLAQANDSAARTSYWKDLGDGFRYLLKWPGLLGTMIMAMSVNFLFSPCVAMLPLVITREFGGGAADLGWVQSLFGVGVIFGGTLLSIWGGFRKRIVTSLSGVTGIGFGVLLIGLAPPAFFWLLLAANFLIGFSQAFANGPLMAVFQSTVDPDLQGRVLSLVGAGTTAMMPLSLLIAGPLADQLSVRFWFIFSGTICILISLTGTLIPAIMHIEENRRPAADPAATI